mgnify:CR=1 FL=1
MKYVFYAPEPEEMSKALNRLLAAQREYDEAMKEMRRITFVPCFARLKADDDPDVAEEDEEGE